jgi:hypothetical protein
VSPRISLQPLADPLRCRPTQRIPTVSCRPVANRALWPASVPKLRIHEEVDSITSFLSATKKDSVSGGVIYLPRKLNTKSCPSSHTFSSLLHIPRPAPNHLHRTLRLSPWSTHLLLPKLRPSLQIPSRIPMGLERGIHAWCPSLARTEP